MTKGAQFTYLFNKADAGIHEEADTPDRGGKLGSVEPPGGAHRVEYRNSGTQRIGDLLHRRGSGFLEMVGAHIDRVPFRHVFDRIGDHVADKAQARLGRKDIRAARQIFFYDVVLRRALEGLRLHPLALSRGNIQRQQPGRRAVNRHGGIHLAERNIGEQGFHIADMTNRDADFSNLPARQGVIAVVAGLRRQVEGNRQAGLAFTQIEPVECITRPRGRVTGIGSHDPGPIFGAICFHTHSSDFRLFPSP